MVSLAAREANSILSCIKRSTDSRLREIILIFYSGLIRPHWNITYNFGLKIQERHQKLRV